MPSNTCHIHDRHSRVWTLQKCLLVLLQIPWLLAQLQLHSCIISRKVFAPFVHWKNLLIPHSYLNAFHLVLLWHDITTQLIKLSLLPCHTRHLRYFVPIKQRHLVLRVSMQWRCGGLMIQALARDILSCSYVRHYYPQSVTQVFKLSTSAFNAGE